jgi:hypothetical protein
VPPLPDYKASELQKKTIFTVFLFLAVTGSQKILNRMQHLLKEDFQLEAKAKEI